MIGAIIGDVVGSRFEFHPHKSKEFELFDKQCKVTDDTMMTLAIAESLMETKGDMSLLECYTIECMKEIGHNYPNVGYGERFAYWLRCYDDRPYNSFGNGSAMRVSPVAYVAKSLDEVKELSNIVTRVTHNHEEGLKGAEAVAVAVYMALHGEGKDDIREYVESHYYHLDFTLDEIRPTYEFEVSCMKSVPESIECFLEGEDYEDVIRNAVSMGGDSDTMACIAGAIAEAYYGVPTSIRSGVLEYLDDYMLDVIHRFESTYKIY